VYSDPQATRSLWKHLAVVSALLLLLTYLFIYSRSPDLVRRANMHEELQTLALYDAELTRDVLLARAGLLSSYDSLAQTAQKLRATLDTVRQENDGMSGPTARQVRPYLDELSATLEDKLTLIEYFKSDNALLRNSSTYFVRIGRERGERAEAGISPLATDRMMREQSEPPASVLHGITEDWPALSEAMLRFMQSPDAGDREAQQALEHLSAVSILSTAGKALAAHGRLIVDMLPRVDALLRQIVATPLPARIEAVQDVVFWHSNRIEARAQVFRVLLYLVAVVLLGYLLYQFGRLRVSARALRRANQDLQSEMEERWQVAEALRSSEERFRAITESANDAIVSADRQGQIVSWNSSAEAIFGYRSEDILGRSGVCLVPERYHRAYDAHLAEWAAGGRCPLAGRMVELTGQRKDGREFPLEISFSTWSTAQGHYVTGMIRDLSVRKQLEEISRQQELQLIQANKMAAVGTLISGVAHEINAPNQLVLMNAGVLRDAWADAVDILDAHRREHGEFPVAGLSYAEMRGTIPALLQEVHDGAERVDRIVADLKDFARPQTRGTRRRFHVNDAVQRAIRLLAHSIRTRTDQFEVALASDVPAIDGDAQQMEQVVVNLVTNALEALPDRKRAVRVTTAHDGTRRAVVLEVSDEGIGIPPEHLGRVCHPFFTTKQHSGGTGLGLAITSSLVAGHGGQISFRSSPDSGTRVTVTLPVLGVEDQPAGHETSLIGREVITRP